MSTVSTERGPLPGVGPGPALPWASRRRSQDGEGPKTAKVRKTWWLSTLRSSWTHPAAGSPRRRAGQGPEPQLLRGTFGCNRCFRSRLGAVFAFGRDQKRRPRPETPSRAGAEGNPTTFRGDGHKEREYLWVPSGSPLLIPIQQFEPAFQPEPGQPDPDSAAVSITSGNSCPGLRPTSLGGEGGI